MRLLPRTLFTVVTGLALALSGCSKKEEPETVPVPSTAAPATVTADPAPEASTTAAAAAEPAPKPAAVPQNTPPKSFGSIDGCCAGISAVKSSGRDAASKAKAAGAALACPGIAKKVKEGQTSRSDALIQIRALLGGVNVPECT